MASSYFNKGIYLVITNEKDINNAHKIADFLLGEKLISCVTFKNIESHFWWKGDIVNVKEVQLLIKCREENINKVIGKITDCHSYEVPEIIYFRVSANKKFHNWVNSI